MVIALTKLFFSSIRTGAVWVTEAFISYCEMLVRTGLRTTVAVFVAILLIRASINYDANWLLLIGVMIGGLALLSFALVWSLVYMTARAFAELSDIAKEEIEKLSNIFFLFFVTLFYLGIDQAQRHPVPLKFFLGVMFLLFISAILPGRGQLMTFFRKRFQLLVVVPVVLITILAIVPEAIVSRVTNGHWLEKASGTVSGEVQFRIDEQDQIIDLATGRPMELFERVSPKGKAPKALKGWTRDKAGNYHLWSWFEGQNNSTSSGQEITLITLAKVDDIIIETKRALEKKLADEKNVADQQMAVAKAEAAQANAQNEAVQKRIEADRLIREIAEEERRELALRPIKVESTVFGKPDQGEGIIIVRPSTPFIYRGQTVQPEQSAITLNVVEVKDTSNKKEYLLLLQPQMLITDAYRYDISQQTGAFNLTVKKDDSRSLLKILGGAAAGAVIGGILDGKEGALKGSFVGIAVGTVYVVSAHGKKFKLMTGDKMPAIIIKPDP